MVLSYSVLAQSWPPLLSMLKSIPFWSLFLLHFGNLWGLYFLLTGAPKFMNEVLKFNLAKAGILASLPYLARFFAGILFGSLGDYLLRSERLSATTIRKVFCLFCKSIYLTPPDQDALIFHFNGSARLSRSIPRLHSVRQ